MRKPTHESRKAELAELVPWLKDRPDYLSRILNHMDAIKPRGKRHTLAFRMLFGLDGHAPMSHVRAGQEIGVSGNAAALIRKRIVNVLMLPHWKQEATWPQEPW